MKAFPADIVQTKYKVNATLTEINASITSPCPAQPIAKPKSLNIPKVRNNQAIINQRNALLVIKKRSQVGLSDVRALPLALQENRSGLY